MVPLASIEGKTGFRTIYSFAEDAAEVIKAQGASRGMARFPVYADKVVWDFDQGESGVKDAIAWAKELDLPYALFSSGSKGFHFEVPHTPIFDVNVPYTHKCLVEKVGIPTDPSLYHAARLFRLEGTIHEKTGKPKVLVERHDGGSILELSIKTPEPTRFSISQIDDEDVSKFLFQEISNRIGNSPGCGRRHVWAWGMARDAYRTGLSYEATLELLKMVNSTWGTDAKDDAYIENACSQGWE